jgi:hypothetical protein
MDISIRQGETLQIPVVADDITATTVRFIATQEGVIVYDLTETFSVVDGKANATIRTEDTFIETGEYEYMLVVKYSDGTTDILPDTENCIDDDCELPKLIMCKGLPSGVS